MEKNTSKKECTPNKREGDVVKSLLQMCKDANGAAFFNFTYGGDIEVSISARKKGFVCYNEFSVEQLKAIKAMSEDKKAIVAEQETKEFYQEIINTCDFNIDCAHDDADE